MFRPFESDTDLMITDEEKVSMRSKRMHASYGFIKLIYGQPIDKGLTNFFCGKMVEKIGPRIDRLITSFAVDPETKEIRKGYNGLLVTCPKCIEKMKKLGL